MCTNSYRKKIFTLAPAAVNFLMVIYDSFFSTSLHGESDFASVDVSLKIGGYLIIIAGIIILAISVSIIAMSRYNKIHRILYGD